MTQTITKMFPFLQQRKETSAITQIEYKSQQRTSTQNAIYT